jgi:hypothetical protein
VRTFHQVVLLARIAVSVVLAAEVSVLAVKAQGRLHRD